MIKIDLERQRSVEVYDDGLALSNPFHSMRIQLTPDEMRLLAAALHRQANMLQSRSEIAEAAAQEVINDHIGD